MASPKDFTWTGNGDGSSFSHANNWAPAGGPPGTNSADDTAAITNGDTVELDASTTIADLTVDHSTLDVSNGNALTVSDETVVGASTSTDPGNPDSFLNIDTGGFVQTDTLDIGLASDAAGTVSITGSVSSIFYTTGSAVVGDNGIGNIYLYGNGGLAVLSVGTSLEIGKNNGSVGLVSLQNGALAATGDYLLVGDDGVGTLNIESGSQLGVGPLTGPIDPGTGVDMTIGNGPDGYGTVTVTGSGSELDVSRQIAVGGANSLGGNTLNIWDGAVVNANLSADGGVSNVDALAVGFESWENQPYTDTVSIDGAGSQLNANGTIVVGVNGYGFIAVSNGGSLSGQSYATGVSGIGQNAGSSGEIDVDASSYSDGDLKVGDAGQGYFFAYDNSTITLGDDLVIAAQVGSSGYFGLGDTNYDPDASTLTVGAINVGGDWANAGDPGAVAVGPDFGIPGGNGNFDIESNSVATTNYLGVWGSIDGIGTVDFSNLTGGALVVGNLPDGTTAADFPDELLLNPGGTLDLDNGVIIGGYSSFTQGGYLNLNGGTYNITPFDERIDDSHSVLRGVTIVGADLTISNDVLTLADSTIGQVTDENSNYDNILIKAYDHSLVDLVAHNSNQYTLGGMVFDPAPPNPLPQYVLLWDSYLTVDASGGGAAIPADPGISGNIIQNTSYFLIQPGSKVEGTGAIVSDYDPIYNPNPTLPDAPGHFSYDVNLINSGLVEATYNDAAGDDTGALAVLTNYIFNNPDGIFRADDQATLNIGDDTQPLDSRHWFANLSGRGDGTTALVTGAYVTVGGTINVNGQDFNGVDLGPITALSAVLYLTDVQREVTVGEDTFTVTDHGDLFVNGTPIEDSLTLITPSSDGEGDLVLLNSQTFWSHSITIAGLPSYDPQTYTLEDGTTGSGGGLYIDNSQFDGPGLFIEAADPNDAGSHSAFISGNGRITAPVEMDGIAYTVAKYHVDDDSVYGQLIFNGPVTGTGGQYYIDASSDAYGAYSSTLEFDHGLTGSDNFVTFHGPNDVGGIGTSLWLTMPFINVAGNPYSYDFDATIQNFGGGDDIELFNIHATSLNYDTNTDLLSLFDAKGNNVANLQFDATTVITADDTFGLSYEAGGGLTSIRLGDPGLYDPHIGLQGGQSLSGDVTESNGVPQGVETTSVGLTYSDANPGNTYFYVLHLEGDPPLGSLTLGAGSSLSLTDTTVDDGNGGNFHLDYTVADGALDFLGAGETKIDTLTVELSDGHKSTSTTYQVTLHGVNDAPVIGMIDLDATAFTPAGDASVATGAAHPDNFIGDNIYNLLPPISGVPGGPEGSQGNAGAIWQQVDLGQDFAIHARLFFGNNLFGDSSGGSDGITFTLQDQGTSAVGDSGNSLGVGAPGHPSIADAVGVKFDTYNNSFQGFSEQAYDFSQFFAHGNNEALLSENSNQKQLGNGNIDDGSWHDLIVTWNAATHTLSYTFDDAVSDSLDFTGTDFDFSGVNPLYAGFTASSGSAYSPEQVEVVSFTNGTQLSVSPDAYTIDGVNDQAGLTQDEVNALPVLASAGGTINFSDPDQTDTHVDGSEHPLVTVTPGSVISAPGYWSGGVVGNIVLDNFVDTVNGLNGQITGHFEVADSDIAYLNAGDTLTETFNVTISDNNGGVSAPQTITVVITGAENQPTAANDEYNTPPGQALDTAAALQPSVLANDIDPDQHALSVQSSTNPSHGTLSMNADGSFVYTPDAGFHGDDSFTYTAVDQTLTSTATVTLHVNSVPQVTVTGAILVPTNDWQEINAFNIPINVSDADGDPVVAYRFTDSANDPTSAHLWFVNGGDVAQGGSVDVPVDRLGDFWVGGGSVRGIDTMQVQVFDGYQWSAAQDITIITDTPPVVTPATTVFDPDQTVALSSIFTATDADGDPITQYQVLDAKTGGSHLLHNGVEQAENTFFTITQAELDNPGEWAIATASTSHDINQFIVSASDGTAFSTFASIGVVTGSNSAPVVDITGPELVKVGQWINLGAALPFTVSDADGDAPVSYTIQDLGSGAGSAQLWFVSGYVAQGGTVVVSSHQLSSLWLKGGAAAGSESLRMTVNDGHDSSLAQDVTVRTVTPSVTVTGDLIVQPNDWLNITPLIVPITVDPSDPAVKYRFTDLSADANSDYLWFNHNLMQGDSVTFDASQLSTLWVHGAVGSGTDMLQVEIFDGYTWSAAQDIAVITNASPVVSAATTSFDVDQTLAATSIFSVADAEGDAITQYKLTDLTAGGAHLTLNGVEQTDNTPVTISAADLAQLQIVTAASDQLNNGFAVQVFDGHSWSAATTINVNTLSPPPVVTVTDALELSPSEWHNFNASNLPFSVTGANLDNVTKYRFTDVGTDGDSAHIWFNTDLAQGGTAQTPAPYLNEVWVQGGAHGIDTLRVQVFDGFQWSAPADIYVIASAQPVNSNPGAHVVTGGTTGADDTVTGTGASDTFVFAPNFGNDTVNNYTPGQDVVALDHTIFATAADAVGAAHDVGGNAVITVNASNSITFTGVLSATLHNHESDFHIV